MEIKTTFRFGPAIIEITAENEEDLKTAIENALTSIKQNIDLLKEISSEDLFRISVSPVGKIPSFSEEFGRSETEIQKPFVIKPGDVNDWGEMNAEP